MTEQEMDEKIEKRQVWWLRGKDFLVEVIHRTQPLDEFRPSWGPDRWNVYVYVYTTHKLFSKTRSELNQILPLHGGESYFWTHVGEEGKLTAHQIGCDYGHLYDERYTHMATKEQASEVFFDARKLFDVLSETNL